MLLGVFFCAKTLIGIELQKTKHVMIWYDYILLARDNYT